MGLWQQILIVFKFWDQVVWFARKIEGTPADKHEKILIQIGEEVHEFAKSGRPKWD